MAGSKRPNPFEKRKGKFSGLITAGKKSENNNEVKSDTENIPKNGNLKNENTKIQTLDDVEKNNNHIEQELNKIQNKITNEKNNKVNEVVTLEEVKNNQIVKDEKEEFSNEPDNNNGSIFIAAQEKVIKKKYANFYLKETTINNIEKYAGKGKGKTGMSKSELVDYLLEQAFKMLKVK